MSRFPRISDARRTSLLLSVFLVGCASSDRALVTGQALRYDGSPLIGATVTARSNETGAWASGITDAEGRFALSAQTPGEGLPAGDYYVVILEDRGDANQRPATIPAKYSTATASGLSLKVEQGQSREMNIKLDAA